MTTTAKPDDSHFDRIRRNAIALKLQEAAKAAGLKIKEGAVADLAGRALIDHTTDEDGYLITRAGGKHVSALEFLHKSKTDAHYFFEPAAGSPGGAAGDPPLPKGAQRWIDAKDAGRHINEIADGKLVVRPTGDGT